jgi:hypothetical protein
MKGILDDIYKNNYLIKKNDNIDDSDQDKMKKEIQDRLQNEVNRLYEE